MTAMTPELGARNLLLNCAGARAGDRLLIAYEPPEHGFYDSRSVGVITGAAEALGLTVEALDVGFNADNPHLEPQMLARFEAADIILFLARLGDQLRFSDMPPGKTIIVSSAISEELLGSGFGAAHHSAFLALKSAVNDLFQPGATITITCPLGTDVTGALATPLAAEGDTTVRRFPMSVFTPVPAAAFSGRVAMTFLTGTGSRYYSDYTIEFGAPVFAVMENGRLTGFDGDPADVATANAQYDRVARTFGIDRNFVHSWHAGIHPGCGYNWQMRTNYERWGGAAFGNPRILHFHTCGAYAPGEISWNVFDPTVAVDGAPVWDNGVLRADRIPGGQDILATYPCAARVFAAPDRAIGDEGPAAPAPA